MKNQNINTSFDTNGVTARWFTRLFALAAAGIVTSVLFGVLMSPEYRGIIASLVNLH